MNVDIDHLLLDRGFQPVAERLARWVSCFALARACLVGIVALQSVILAWDLHALRDPPSLALVAIATLAQYYIVPFVYQHVRRIERQARPGLLNPQRIVLRPARLVWLAATLVICCAWLGSAFPPLITLQLAVGCLWCATLYFESCSPAPPRLRAFRRSFGRVALAAAPVAWATPIRPSLFRSWPSLPGRAKLACSRTADRLAPFSARRRPGWPRSGPWSRTTRCPAHPPLW